MMPEQNPVNELIEIEKANQQLLGQLLASQEELIAISKSQQNQGRWKLVLESLKIVMWPVIILVSLYFSIQFMKDFTSSIAENANPANIIQNLRGGQETDASASINLGGAGEILQELLGN